MPKGLEKPLSLPVIFAERLVFSRRIYVAADSSTALPSSVNIDPKKPSAYSCDMKFVEISPAINLSLLNIACKS